MRHASHKLPLILATVALLAGCAVNPVTGKKELMLVSEGSELEIGQQNYAPARQSQGGDYRLDPELQRYVQEVGGRLAAVSDRPLPYEFTVLNNSVPNAWSLPGGKIALNRGLLVELHSEAELAAVLGHEIVHAAARHSAAAMSRGMLLQGGLLVAQVAASDSDYGNLYAGAASIGAGLLMQRYSRQAELEADRYGMQYLSRAGYDPQAAISLQETFVKLNEGKSGGWLAGLFASHPPSLQRVEANRATAATLPGGGTRGEDAYRAALARTLRAKPAYDAYDEGRKALAAKHPEEALAKAGQAIRLEPAEAHFHALVGDVHLVQKNHAGAIRAYSDAIARNDGFFYYYLQRGLAAEHLKDDESARRDLEASIRLLPTGPAYYSLGNIALRSRDNENAKKYFELASGAEGPVGEAATRSLLRLDLPQSPDKYLRQQALLDNNGMLVVAVGNPTRVPVTGLRIGIRYRDASGQVREASREVGGTLAAGQQVQVATRLGPFTAANQFQVAITQARVAE
jgi:predicted Zn-dependent protease